MYIDGHLDLAFNVVAHKRDLRRDMMALRRKERRTDREVLVTLPELRKGGVGIVFATLFTLPRSMKRPAGAPPLTERQASLCYETAEQAHAHAVEQLELYERWEAEGEIRILRHRRDLDDHLTGWADGAPDGRRSVGAVLLMEGADPIRTPDELPWWVDRGLRLLGPAWQRTRYSGGTDAPGPLTPEGRELVRAMKEHGVPLDVSHLAEESFWDALDLDPEHVLASHSNARAITPGDRHLSDAMIRAVAARRGVLGVVLGNSLLKDGITHAHPKESVTLDDVRRQAAYIADLVGWEHVAVGSDFDGGFGLQETPLGITRGSDFPKLGAVAPPAAREGFLGGNWLRFLHRALPE